FDTQGRGLRTRITNGRLERTLLVFALLRLLGSRPFYLPLDRHDVCSSGSAVAMSLPEDFKRAVRGHNRMRLRLLRARAPHRMEDDLGALEGSSLIETLPMNGVLNALLSAAGATGQADEH